MFVVIFTVAACHGDIQMNSLISCTKYLKMPLQLLLLVQTAVTDMLLSAKQINCLCAFSSFFFRYCQSTSLDDVFHLDCNVCTDRKKRERKRRQRERERDSKEGEREGEKQRVRDRTLSIFLAPQR